MVQPGPQPILLVSEQVNSPRYYCKDATHSLEPRLDYEEVARKIGGAVYGQVLRESKLGKPIAHLESKLKLDLGESAYAFLNLERNSLILSTSEKTGLPMAALLSMTKRQNPHILISHHISSHNKKRLFGIWSLYRSFAKILFVSQPQARYATDVLGIPPDRVKFIFDKVDHHFFTPQTREPEEFILSVGNEERDYQSLISAISGTKMKLVIVASSPWSKFRTDISTGPNITILERISYLELRELYARARLVVLPLNDVDYAAGANAALEAMAMAKPLILLESRGLEGYVSHDETGRVISSRNPEDLREAIFRLWEDEPERSRLGTNARQSILDRMNFQVYTETITEILRGYLAEVGREVPQAAEMVNVNR
jgi:glycosyltransferase involved in cell wall biosynthesis